MDTFPGFALRCAPGSQAVFDTLVEETGTGLWPWRHYEVFLEHRACAQYFDLEYSRELNPEMDPGAVTDAFFFMLRAFLLQTLGLEPVVASVWELDSTTAGKYSKHIVVKRLVSVGGCSKDIEGSSSATQHFKWRDNAQAGLFVAQFLEYCRRQREIDPMSPARLLFARASLSSAVAAAGSGFAGGVVGARCPLLMTVFTAATVASVWPLALSLVNGGLCGLCWVATVWRLRSRGSYFFIVWRRLFPGARHCYVLAVWCRRTLVMLLWDGQGGALRSGKCNRFRKDSLRLRLVRTRCWRAFWRFLCVRGMQYVRSMSRGTLGWVCWGRGFVGCRAIVATVAFPSATIDSVSARARPICRTTSTWW